MANEGKITVTYVTRGSRNLKKSLDEISKSAKNANVNAKVLDTGIASLGNRLGFVAFQMTFLAGVTGRALGEITQRLQTLVQDGSKDLSTIARAIVRSGFDISAQSGEAREAVDLLNNAMRTFASGQTIFNIQEVAGAFDAVGRAVNFSGTAIERAKKQIVVANEVMKLMTIEQVDAEEAAKAVVKTMKIFNIEGANMAKITDTLVAVNNQSTATLDSLIASLGFGAQQAHEFGLSMQDTVAILGVIQDRIGGERGTAGRSLSILLQNLSDTTTSLDPNLKALGVTLRDDTKKMRPLVEIVGDLNRVMKQAGPPGSLARKRILELINATARGERGLLALVEGFDELKTSIESANNSVGIANRISDTFKQLPEERIKRMTNAFNSLRTELVGALSPAVEVIADTFSKLASNGDIQLFFEEVGTALAETIVPAVKTLSQYFKAFALIMKQNTIILKAVTGGFSILLGILTALFIVGTIGALVAAMASVLERVATSQIAVTLATNAAFGAFLKFAVALFGVFLILKGIDQIIGIVKDGIDATEAPALASAAAITALGAALTLLPFKIKGVGTAFAEGGIFAALTTGLKGALGAIKGFASTAFRTIAEFIASIGLFGFGTTFKNLGESIGGALTGGLKGSFSGIGGILRSIISAASKHPIAAAIILGIAVGTALGLAIGQAIQDAKDFGFNSAGELIISDWAITIAKLRKGFDKWVEDSQKNLADLINGFTSFGEALQNLNFDEVGRQLNEKIFGPIKQSILDAVKTFGKLGEAAFGNPDAFLHTEAIDNLNKLLSQQIKDNKELQAIAQSGSFKGQEAAALNILSGSKAFERWAKDFSDVISRQDLLKLIGDFSIPIQNLSATLDNAGQEWLNQQQSLQDGTASVNDYIDSMNSVNGTLANMTQANQDQILTNENLNNIVNDNVTKYQGLSDSIDAVNTFQDDLGGSISTNKDTIDNATAITDALSNTNTSLTDSTVLNDTSVKSLTDINKSLHDENDTLVNSTIQHYKTQQLLVSALQTGLIPETLALITQSYNTVNVYKELQGSIQRAADAFNALADTVANTSVVVGDNGSVSLQGGVSAADIGALLHLAKGGIVTKATPALIGESGPEAVVPLGRSGTSIGGDTFVFHINIDGIPDEATGEDIANQVADKIISKVKNRHNVMI